MKQIKSKQCLLLVGAISMLSSGCTSISEKEKQEKISAEANATFKPRMLSVYHDSTMKWQEAHFAGAAISQPDYVFVIDKKTSTSNKEAVSDLEREALALINASNTPENDDIYKEAFLESDIELKKIDQSSLLLMNAAKNNKDNEADTLLNSDKSVKTAPLADSVSNESLKTSPNSSIEEGRNYSFYQMARWERYCNSGQGMDEADWNFIDSLGADASKPPASINSCMTPNTSRIGYISAWRGWCRNDSLTSNELAIVKKTVHPSSFKCERLEQDN